MKNERFNFFVPVEFLKGGTEVRPEDRYKNMIIQGVASDDSLDLDQQSMEPNGFELGVFKAAGLINYEHQAKKSPKAFIGEPIEAEIKNNKFIIKAKLWEKSQLARDLYDTVDIMKSSGSKRKLAWSIEGTPLMKDPRNPNHITKALITHCALTFMPKNFNSFAQIVKGGTASYIKPVYEQEEGVDYLYKGVFGENEYTLHKDFTITKAMCAGAETGQQLVGKDTNGAALKKESLDPDLKILTIPIASIRWAADNWEGFKEDTKKALHKALHNQLEKGGEGSRGGKVIGHARSGKPIYEKDIQNMQHGFAGAVKDAYGKRASKKQIPNSKFFIEATDKNIDKKLAEYGIVSDPKSMRYYKSDDGKRFEIFTHSESNKKGWMIHPVDLKADAKFYKKHSSKNEHDWDD